MYKSRDRIAEVSPIEIRNCLECHYCHIPEITHIMLNEREVYPNQSNRIIWKRTNQHSLE